MAEGEGSFVVDAAGSSEFALGEIVAADAFDSPEKGSAGLDVAGDNGGGEEASFLDAACRGAQFGFGRLQVEHRGGRARILSLLAMVKPCAIKMVKRDEAALHLKMDDLREGCCPVTAACC